jgi:DNA-binding transcriptional LysR family regulator
MNEPLETAELLAFTKTVEVRSLSRAAAELGVPRATVGRRLQRLEARLGVRLLRRTTRTLALTDAGESLYRHARLALEAVREAEVSVRRIDDKVRGELRVAVPPFTHPGFHALIGRFARRYPDVRLLVHFSTQHVDLRSGGFDVAVRGTAELEPGLVARVLGRSKLIAVASPDYLAEHGTPRSLRDLRKHRCIVGFARGELPETHWTDKKGRRVQVEAAFAANDIVLLTQMALRGLGIAYVLEPMVRPFLARGTLVHLLKGKLEMESRMSIVYAEREFLPPQVRAFVDEFAAWAKRHPDVALWPSVPSNAVTG